MRRPIRLALGLELRRSGYRVLLYDLVGRGHSSCRNQHHTAALFVSQLSELLYALDLSPDAAHHVGISLGGGVALEYARYFPHRVKSLTLIAAVGSRSSLYIENKPKSASILFFFFENTVSFLSPGLVFLKNSATFKERVC